MKTNVSYIINETGLIIIVEGQIKRVPVGSYNYSALKGALAVSDFNRVTELLYEREEYLAEKKMTPITDDRVKLNQSGQVEFNGKVLPDYMTRRVHSQLAHGMPVDNLLLYLEKLMKNPSSTVRERLSDFLDASDVGINQDGCLLLYKRVRHDYLDCHSATIDNSVGSVVFVDRSEVDDDHRRTCSRGLHVCSEHYLSHYTGDRILLCSVDPEDVVAIPYDYNDSKMRTCGYYVLADVTDSFSSTGSFDSGATLAGVGPSVVPVAMDTGKTLMTTFVVVTSEWCEYTIEASNRETAAEVFYKKHGDNLDYGEYITDIYSE